MTPGTSGLPEAIGGYAVEALIGSGGQSEVFALSPVPRRPPLALKWSRQSFAPPWTDPLAAEFRALSRLRHPQLLAPYDFGYHEGRAFLVLERVDGPELFDELGNNKLESLAKLVRAVSPVLSFLHRRGVIHRDLKPANFRWAVAVGSAGESRRLCLLDLGLASRPRDPAKEGRAGTLCYMAPEVLREGRANARSDIYSLGVILYEWLTGASPFAGTDPAEIINGHLTGQVRWPEGIRTTAGNEVIAVIDQLLAKDPEQRPVSIEDMLTRFARAGLAVDPAPVVTENMRWHRETTRRNYPEVDFPIDLSVGSPKPATIVVAGDPGSGQMKVLNRWEQELKICGWPVKGSGGELCAVPPDGKEGALTIQTRSDPTVVDASETIADGCRWVVLRPLGEAEVARYLSEVFFEDACVRELLPAALRLSSGLPDALDVLIAEWTVSGAVRWNGNSWTVDPARLGEVLAGAGLRQVYHQGLREVTANQVRALSAASVFGCEISTDVLADVLYKARIDRRALEELFARGVLTPWSNPNEPMINARFRWSGLPEVWTADLPPEHRRELHAAVASALEQRKDTWGERIFRRLALHFREAGDFRAACHAALRWAETTATAEHAEEAHRFLDLAQEAAAQVPSEREQDAVNARIAFLRGRTHKASGTIEEAQRCFRRVLALTRRINDARLAAEAAKHLGDTYKSTRRHARGERILRVALKRFQQLGDEAEISHTLNNLGNIAWVQGEFDRGLQYYHQALAVQRRLGLTADVASTLSNIGVMHLGKCELGRARACMLESLQLKESLNQQSDVARTLNNLGLVSLYIGEFDSAVDCFARASTINKDEGAWEGWLLNRRNLLDAWISQAAYRRVVDEAPGLLRKTEELDEWANRAYVHLFAARAFHELAEYRSSWFHLEQVAGLIERVNDPTLAAQHFILLAERRLRLGEADAALRALAAALEQANTSSDLRDRPEVYLAAAKAEHDAQEMPPELYAAGPEAYRLFEKPGMNHRLFEVLLATDDDALSTFLTHFPLPEDFVSAAGIHYVGPPTQEGIWLWRLARKAVNDHDRGLALRLLDALVAWCGTHGTRELGWRALSTQGMLYHQAHDWELAARAFTAAVQTLEAVAATIEPPEAREYYLAGEDVRWLYGELAAFSGRFAER